MSRAQDLLAALVNAQIGGFLAHPPGLEGDQGLGLVGIHGVPRARTWDVSASARAPLLVGDAVSFVVFPDGTILLEDTQPDDSLAPLADAIEASIQPPYRAAAVRRDGEVWAILAEKTAIFEIPESDGDQIEMTVVDGNREVTIDGQHTIRPLRRLDELAKQSGDVAIHAERVDGDFFAVDVFVL